mmetsp:Transcript_29394/g.63027  ORF Transcript_29394/g.63027 Transcript_29394/m.63027 type:complete len:306 (+) Transcript_29394:434-1351(+)
MNQRSDRQCMHSRHAKNSIVVILDDNNAKNIPHESLSASGTGTVFHHQPGHHARREVSTTATTVFIHQPGRHGVVLFREGFRIENRSRVHAREPVPGEPLDVLGGRVGRPVLVDRNDAGKVQKERRVKGPGVLVGGILPGHHAADIVRKRTGLPEVLGAGQNYALGKIVFCCCRVGVVGIAVLWLSLFQGPGNHRAEGLRKARDRAHDGRPRLVHLALQRQDARDAIVPLGLRARQGPGQLQEGGIGGEEGVRGSATGLATPFDLGPDQRSLFPASPEAVGQDLLGLGKDGGGVSVPGRPGCSRR